MRISKEFNRQIHLYVSDSQWDALHEEALSQRIGVSSLVRGCIDSQLDPELRLKSIIDNRDTELTRLHGEVLSHLDEMEAHEYDELSLSEGTTEEMQIEWLKAKKEQIGAPKVTMESTHELPVDALLQEFKDRA